LRFSRIARSSSAAQTTLWPRERFLGADQILDRYHATASSEELDLDGRFTRARIVPDTFDGTQDVQWSKRRLEIEVVDFNAGVRLSRKDNRWGVCRCVGFRSPNATRSFDTLSGVSTVHTSKSRVTSVEPCNTPAKPPTMTKSMSASRSRSMRRLSCVTELLACSFHLEHQVERGLMLNRALVVGILEARPDQAHVEAGALGDLGSGFGPGHGDCSNVANLAEREGFEPSKGF
jgi:hypothetical protein